MRLTRACESPSESPPHRCFIEPTGRLTREANLILINPPCRRVDPGVFGSVELIGAPGFEPGTSPTRTVRATRLRHAPKSLTSLALLDENGRPRNLRDVPVQGVAALARAAKRR